MFRVHKDIVRGHECLDVTHELLVERYRGADRERQAVNQEWISLGEVAKFLAKSAADMNPVLRGNLHEIDFALGNVLQLVGQRPAQAKAGAAYRVLRVCVTHTAQDLIGAAIITLQIMTVLYAGIRTIR